MPNWSGPELDTVGVNMQVEVIAQVFTGVLAGGRPIHFLSPESAG